MSLRLGCVQYLNAQPLIHGWPDKVEFGHPSALCQALAQGDLDVALVSSFEFLRNPGYRVVDGLSISSDGPVYSVVVAYAGELSAVEEIELDPASETSANLLRCLLGGQKSRARVVPFSSSQLTRGRARLLIGDQAIRFREQHPELHYWDLGEEWRRLSGLPFVYALWLARPEVVDAAKLADRLRKLRDDNLANLDRLIAAQPAFSPEFCARYFHEHLRFNLGEKEKSGLQSFASLCAKHGLLPKRDLKFDLI